MNKKFMKNLIVSIAAVAFLGINANGKVYADQYGEDIKNKSFRIEKEVRIKDEGDFEDKLVLDSDESDEIIEFRVRIENVGEVETDDMKMEDFLPEEMYRVGGDGLTEYFDDFEPGDVVTFYIDAKIDEDEFDNENFDKCVVNKAELYYDDAFEGADTAIVCYGDVEVTELPETGFATTMIPVGLGLMVVGALIKRSRK
ncbi:hypothetical protein GF360_00225 [candidate division WWE3 bacterium]|nr:hypothetical protein [candidate division WWE3 bacterium]